MFRKLVAMTICASVCTLAIGCGDSGPGGGGNEEMGNKAIQDAKAAMEKKRAEEAK